MHLRLKFEQDSSSQRTLCFRFAMMPLRPHNFSFKAASSAIFVHSFKQLFIFFCFHSYDLRLFNDPFYGVYSIRWDMANVHKSYTTIFFVSFFKLLKTMMNETEEKRKSARTFLDKKKILIHHHHHHHFSLSVVGFYFFNFVCVNKEENTKLLHHTSLREFSRNMPYYLKNGFLSRLLELFVIRECDDAIRIICLHRTNVVHYFKLATQLRADWIIFLVKLWVKSNKSFKPSNKLKKDIHEMNSCFFFFFHSDCIF